jgi:hypothetical protein
MRLHSKPPGSKPPMTALPPPVAERRLDVLYRVDSLLIESLRSEVRECREEQARTLQALVTGELRIFGMPVRAEWPEGRPFGMTDDQLRQMLGGQAASTTG